MKAAANTTPVAPRPQSMATGHPKVQLRRNKTTHRGPRSHSTSTSICLPPPPPLPARQSGDEIRGPYQGLPGPYEGHTRAIPGPTRAIPGPTRAYQGHTRAYQGVPGPTRVYGPYTMPKCNSTSCAEECAGEIRTAGM